MDGTVPASAGQEGAAAEAGPPTAGGIAAGASPGTGSDASAAAKTMPARYPEVLRTASLRLTFSLITAALAVVADPRVAA